MEYTTVEEKNNPDRIETYLSLVNHANIATETSTVTTETSSNTTETIIDSIRNNPKITTKEIAAVCGITEDGCFLPYKETETNG